jgi:hypothetical protein
VGWVLPERVPRRILAVRQTRWVASTINEALELTRRTAAELAEIRGWNPKIVIQTDRALAVVLAEHDTGLIAWSDLSPTLQPQDLSVTRTRTRRHKRRRVPGPGFRASAAGTIPSHRRTGRCT